MDETDFDFQDNDLGYMVGNDCFNDSTLTLLQG